MATSSLLYLRFQKSFDSVFNAGYRLETLRIM